MVAGPRDSGEAGVQGLHDAAIAPTLTRLGNIRLEQHTSLQDRRGGMLALLIGASSADPSSMLRRTMYFLYMGHLLVLWSFPC